MENIQFTDEEIKEQLEALGYFNVSQERIKQFKKGNYFLSLLIFYYCTLNQVAGFNNIVSKFYILNLKYVS